MGNPSVLVAEFAEGCDVVGEGPGRDGGPVRGAEWPLCGSLCARPILQKELDFFLVKQIECRSGNYRQHHQNDVALHDAGRHEIGQRGERIGGEHRDLQMPACVLPEAPCLAGEACVRVLRRHACLERQFLRQA